MLKVDTSVDDSECISGELTWNQIIKEDGLYYSPSNARCYLLVTKLDGSSVYNVLYIDTYGGFEPARKSDWADTKFRKSVHKLHLTIENVN